MHRRTFVTSMAGLSGWASARLQWLRTANSLDKKRIFMHNSVKGVLRAMAAEGENS